MWEQGIDPDEQDATSPDEMSSIERVTDDEMFFGEDLEFIERTMGKNGDERFW